MKTRITFLLCAALALAAYGCGDGTGSVDPAGGTSQNDSSTAPDRSARVTFQAQFPGQNQAVKSLMDPATTSILVTYYKISGGTGQEQFELTPDTPTKTVNLLPEAYSFMAAARDADGRTLDSAMTQGTLQVGSNTVILTFLAGNWTFVDAQGNAAPLELSTGGGSLVLDGFELTSGEGQAMYRQAPDRAAAASIAGYSGYRLLWGSRAAATPGTAFSDLTRGSYLMNTAWFEGGPTNGSFVEGAFYNLTKGCGEAGDYQSGPNCSEEPGDRFITIIGNGGSGGASGQDLLPDETFTQGGQPVDMSPFETGTVSSADTMSGSLVEVLLKSSTGTVVSPAQAAKASTAPLTSRGRALAQALQSATKATQSANSSYTDLTLTSAEYAIVCSGTDHGDWQLSDPIDLNNDGTPDAWYSGYLPTANPGTCSTGLTLPTGGKTGEWQDYNQNGVVEWYEFYDQNQDGTVDFGDIQLTHYIRWTEVMDVSLYPFKAKGTPGTKGTFAIRGAFLQFRTVTNSANNSYRGFVDVSLSGADIVESDILGGRLLKPDQSELVLPDTAATFFVADYFAAAWDVNTSSFGTPVLRSESGFNLNLSGFSDADIPTGTWTYELQTRAGTTVTNPVQFPSKTALPVVNGTTMDSAWGQDGSLTLSWQAPGGTFDQYQVLIQAYNPMVGADTPIFRGNVPSTVSSVTIPKSLVDSVQKLLPSMENVQWQVQTRNYAGTPSKFNNYARGNSPLVPVTQPPPL